MKHNFFKKIISLICISGTVCLYAESKSAVSLFNKGVFEQQSQNYYAAVDAFTEALQKNENYGEAWFHLAQCTYELGEYDLTLDYTDRAEKYSRNFNEIRNLRGFAYISLGKLKEAREVFEKVLKEYPNDVDSRFGLAQLDLFDGSISGAEKVYLEALKRKPSNKKALLSLALISSEQGKTDAAEEYISQALTYHSGEAQVHYLAAYIEAKNGNFTEAERRARSAVQINGSYDKAYGILADILYSQKRYDEVIDISDFRLSHSRNIPEAWFIKGLSQEKLGLYEDAIETYSQGLNVNPQNEVMRSAMELLISEYIDVEDDRRPLWAEYHVKKAAEYRRNFDSAGERYEIQQALKIDPLNLNARQSFAELLYTEGFYELYLSQLQFITANSRPEEPAVQIQKDENSPVVKKTVLQKKNEDTIEALSSMMTNTLSAKWNVDTFYLDKVRWNLGLFYTCSPVQMLHPDIEKITAVCAKEIFAGIPSTAVSVDATQVNSFGEAYRLARENACDYFIVLSVDETERSVTLDANVYSARTGTLADKIHVYRTGNDRYANVLRRFRQSVLDMLPIRGKVINHTGSTLLVDLGKSDGIVKGAEFEVIEKGSVYTVDKGTGIAYRENSKLGTLRIDTVNEEISEGTYSRTGFYDVLNDGDEIVLVKLPSDKDVTADGDAPTDTKPAADSSGKPVTEPAQNAEKADETMRKALKMKENALISLIRSID